MNDIVPYINERASIMIESGLPGILLLAVIVLVSVVILRFAIAILVSLLRLIFRLFGYGKKPEIDETIDADTAEKLFDQGVLREKRGDVDGAIASYEAATAKSGGHAMASYHVANLYFHGNGDGRRNPVMAIKHFRKAAMKGITPAMDALAQAYQYGEGVVADPAKAYIWCLVAKAAGVKSAGERQLRYEAMLLKDYTSAHLRAWRADAATLFNKINRE
ncbi:MAG: tetratricopeptide repeat protein [Alphaproteobacteria bacterium]